MKKTFTALLFMLLLSPLCKAQLFNELKPEENINDSKVFITPFLGVGFGMYSFNLNENKSSLVSSSDEFVVPTVFPVGINAMYNLDKVYIGGGLKYQMFKGTLETFDPKEIYTKETKLNFSLLKIYARAEVPVTKAKKGGIGILGEVGTFAVNDVIGEDPSGALFGSLGLNYNIKVSATSNLIIELLMEYNSFSNQINDQKSTHGIYSNELILGYRFGL